MISRIPSAPTEQVDVWRQIAGEVLALLMGVSPRLRMAEPHLANAIELLRQATATYDREGHLPTEADARALRAALIRAAGSPGGEARIRIALYRSDHRIDAVAASRNLWPAEECSLDRIRVNRLRDGSYRHDPAEVRELAEAALR